ncbi:hypothetical protein CcaverHIS641_0305070 [Cutaneotrichosporon cavernicola]|nr:hypothetical protein CcaverHIS641_0305070 [Cutaneotrichosporon cavernicola]
MSRGLETPPVLASIGTVLIDIFEPQSAASLGTSSAVSSWAASSSGRTDSAPLGCSSTGELHPSMPCPTSSLPLPLLASPSALVSFSDLHPKVPSSTPLISSSLPTSASFSSSPSEISPSPRKAPQIEAVGEIPLGGRMVIGGGAMYAIVGARVWLPPIALRTIIDRSPGRRRVEGEAQGGVTAAPPGSLPARENPDEFDDLPRELEEELLSYGPNMWVFNRVPGGRVPRARIGYNGAVRSYAHIIKPVPRTALDLAHGPLFGAEYLHVSPPFSSSDLLNLLSDLPSSWNPKVVFEPAPSSCHPAGRRAFEAAAQRVHALSPVLEEEGEIRKVVEEIVAYLLGLGVPVVAVRCGASGACIGTVEGLRWVPSFFEGEQHRVRDVTGAGNAFIGGYIAGLRLTGDPYTAALYGMVSASFVIEQLGPPSLSVSTDGELWNGDSAQHRLAALSERVPWA